MEYSINGNKKNHLYARTHSCECVTNTLHIQFEHGKYKNNHRNGWKWKIIVECVCVSTFSVHRLKCVLKLMFENDNSNSSGGNSTSICCLGAAYLAMCLSKSKFIEYPRASFDIVCFLVCACICVCAVVVSIGELKKHLIHFYWNICYRCACHMYRLLLFLL